MNLKLWKEQALVINEEMEYEQIENKLKFTIDQVKHSFDKKNKIFERENKEFYFKMDLENKTCLYQLKNPEVILDIEVEALTYQIEDQTIKLEYMLETDDQKTIIEINFLE